MIQKYITSNQMWSLVMALSNFCQIIPHISLSLSQLVASNAAWCVWNSVGSKILARLMNLPMKRWTPLHCINAFVPTSDNKVSDSGFLHSPLLSSLQIPLGHFIIICGADSRLKCTYRMQPPPPFFHVTHCWKIPNRWKILLPSRGYPIDNITIYPGRELHNEWGSKQIYKMGQSILSLGLAKQNLLRIPQPFVGMFVCVVVDHRWHFTRSRCMQRRMQCRADGFARFACKRLYMHKCIRGVCLLHT